MRKQNKQKECLLPTSGLAQVGCLPRGQVSGNLEAHRPSHP